MDLKWNIDNIYTSFTCDEFLSDMKKLDEYINTVNEFKIEKTDKSVEEFLRLNDEYEKLYCKLEAYANLRSTIDVTDGEALDILDVLDDKSSEHKQAVIGFSRWLNNTEDIEELIKNSSYLLQHKFYLGELMKKSRYLLSPKEEVIVAKLQSTGSKAWQRCYMELVSTEEEEITLNGKEEKLTLMELYNLAYDNNSEVRKQGFYKQVSLCKRIAAQCTRCINGIAGEADSICDIRGYESPLEKVLINSRMDFETLKSMVAAIEESLPMFRRYYKKKAEVLGYRSALPFYDVYAGIGNIDKTVSYEECRDTIVSVFNSFSKKLGDFAGRAFEEKWIDAEPRKEKGSFGLSLDIFPMKESRISVNFNGNLTDVGVIGHEIGHAYHSSNLYEETMVNTYYGTPIAETASIFCETLINNELMKSVSPQEELIVLEKSISDVAYFLVEFYGRYLFEKELYEKRNKGTLTVDELNDLMFSIMKRVYGDSIEEDTINPYMWMNKVAYYMPDNEFLNFPYSFGVLFSKGLYNEYLNHGEDFVKKYDYFLSMTSKNTIADVAKIMDIDVHDITFWRSSLKLMEKDINRFIDLA